MTSGLEDFFRGVERGQNIAIAPELMLAEAHGVTVYDALYLPLRQDVLFAEEPLVPEKLLALSVEEYPDFFSMSSS